MEEQSSSFKQKALLIEQEAAEKGEPVSITPAKGLQIGVLVMGLLRQLSNL